MDEKVARILAGLDRRPMTLSTTAAIEDLRHLGEEALAYLLAEIPTARGEWLVTSLHMGWIA